MSVPFINPEAMPQIVKMFEENIESHLKDQIEIEKLQEMDLLSAELSPNQENLVTEALGKLWAYKTECIDDLQEFVDNYSSLG